MLDFCGFDFSIVCVLLQLIEALYSISLNIAKGAKKVILMSAYIDCDCPWIAFVCLLCTCMMLICSNSNAVLL